MWISSRNEVQLDIKIRDMEKLATQKEKDFQKNK